MMFDSRQLAALPAVREFYHLVRNLFGLDFGIIAPDGTGAILPGTGKELNPFCALVQRHPEGRRRCLECDALHARKAALGREPSRYVCHAGFTEFVIPVLVDETVVAHLQCGQILDRPPDAAAWRRARERVPYLAGGRARAALARAFRRSPVIPKSRQRDLIALLRLFAQHAVLAHVRRLLLEQDPHDRIVSKARACLRERFREGLRVADVAAAAGASKRTLARVFHERAGASVLEHLNRLRVAYACDRLRQTPDKIASVALESGFGSIPQFNRVFRAVTGRSAGAWRSSLSSRAPKRKDRGCPALEGPSALPPAPVVRVGRPAPWPPH